MKGTLVAAAFAALAGGVSAGGNHRHAHDIWHEKRDMDMGETCVPGCTTVYYTVTGSPGRMFPVAGPKKWGHVERTI